MHSVSLFATFDLAIDGRRADGAAVVGADLDDDGRLVLLAGDRPDALASLDRGGAAIVPAATAARDGSGIGSCLVVAAADGTAVDLVIAGIAERTLPGRSGDSVLVGWPDARRLGVAGADGFAVRFDRPARRSIRPAGRGGCSLALDPVPLDRIRVR